MSKHVVPVSTLSVSNPLVIDKVSFNSRSTSVLDTVGQRIEAPSTVITRPNTCSKSDSLKKALREDYSSIWSSRKRISDVSGGPFLSSCRCIVTKQTIVNLAEQQG